jgi:hypothetical protein
MVWITLRTSKNRESGPLGINRWVVTTIHGTLLLDMLGGKLCLWGRPRFRGGSQSCTSRLCVCMVRKLRHTYWQRSVSLWHRYPSSGSDSWGISGIGAPGILSWLISLSRKGYCWNNSLNSRTRREWFRSLCTCWVRTCFCTCSDEITCLHKQHTKTQSSGRYIKTSMSAGGVKGWLIW